MFLRWYIYQSEIFLLNFQLFVYKVVESSTTLYYIFLPLSIHIFYKNKNYILPLHETIAQTLVQPQILPTKRVY